MGKKKRRFQGEGLFARLPDETQRRVKRFLARMILVACAVVLFGFLLVEMRQYARGLEYFRFDPSTLSLAERPDWVTDEIEDEIFSRCPRTRMSLLGEAVTAQGRDQVSVEYSSIREGEEIGVHTVSFAMDGEQIDLVPMTVRVIRHIRKIYHCPNCESGIKTAPLPQQPIPGSIASPGTLAHLAVNKYINGMPLYRQEAEFKRLNIPLTRSTLATWMIKAGTLVQPLINLLRETMLDYDVLQMDETRCQVLKEPGKTPQSQSYMWVQRGGPPGSPIILFDYASTRSQGSPRNFSV